MFICCANVRHEGVNDCTGDNIKAHEAVINGTPKYIEAESAKSTAY